MTDRKLPVLLNYKIFPYTGDLSVEKPPLVIVHGLLGSQDNWRSQATRLSKQQTVITVDLRNHGYSPHQTGMSYREMAGDLIHLLQTLKLSSIHLLGHSMGGKVAMWLALHNPSWINKLIVVDIAPKKYPMWHQTVFKALLETPLQQLNSRREIDQYLAQSISERAERAFLLKNLQREKDGRHSWSCNLPEISRSYLKIADFPAPNAQFDHPCCFIRGENSPYVDNNDKSLIQQLFPQSQLFTVRDAGHLPHIEQADDFHQLVSDFL